ncbi:MAG TPA: hypothetical protein VIY86_12270, partial [Pirellulaceae bacterium]
MPGPDEIRFTVNSIQLTLGEILITDDLLIDGATAPVGQVDLRATIGSRIFHIDNGQAAAALVDVASLKLSGGQAIDGGAILNRESLTLRNSIVTGNTASIGGGIANRHGLIVMQSCVVYGNVAKYEGGGIVNNEGSLESHDSTIQGNRVSNLTGAFTFGGGLQNIGRASALLVRSQVLGNSAYAPLPGVMGQGGGISVMLESSLHLIDSVVTDNFAEHNGGGVFVLDNSTARLELNSMVSSNVSGQAGGGLHLQRSMVQILDSFVAGNTTDLRGGGISAANDVILDITNSQVTDNRTDLINPDGSGGGLFLSGYGTATGPQVTITGSQILRNNFSPAGSPGGELGGGISVLFGSRLHIDQSTISQNAASISGGGIFASAEFSAHAPDVTINGTQVTLNKANLTGAGVTLTGGKLQIDNSQIQRNVTSGRGGGLFLTGLGALTSTQIHLNDSDITQNTGSIEGGGIAAGPNLDLQLVQSRVSANATFGAGGGLYLTALGSLANPHTTTIVDSEITYNT